MLLGGHQEILLPPEEFETLHGKGLVKRNKEIVWVPGALRYMMSVLRHIPRPIFRKLPV